MEPSTLTIRDLYPDLTPAELKDAEANLTAYLDLACASISDGKPSSKVEREVGSQPAKGRILQTHKPKTPCKRFMVMFVCLPLSNAVTRSTELARIKLPRSVGFRTSSQLEGRRTAPQEHLWQSRRRQPQGCAGVPSKTTSPRAALNAIRTPISLVL